MRRWGADDEVLPAYNDNDVKSMMTMTTFRKEIITLELCRTLLCLSLWRLSSAPETRVVKRRRGRLIMKIHVTKLSKVE